MLHDPRVEVVYDDARHFILTTNEKFDIITSDPIHPWVKGAATLYTTEYLELAKQHLNPGGVMTQWVPLYESHTDAVKSEIATFFAAYPGGTVWANNEDGHGYDLVMLGQPGPTRIDVDSVGQRLEPIRQRAHRGVARAGGDHLTLRPVRQLRGAARRISRRGSRTPSINRDRNLKLQYIAGLENNSYDNASIFEEFTQYRKFPEDLFVASEEWKNGLSGEAGLPRR